MQFVEELAKGFRRTEWQHPKLHHFARDVSSCVVDKFCGRCSVIFAHRHLFLPQIPEKDWHTMQRHNQKALSYLKQVADLRRQKQEQAQVLQQQRMYAMQQEQQQRHQQILSSQQHRFVMSPFSNFNTISPFGGIEPLSQTISSSLLLQTPQETKAHQALPDFLREQKYFPGPFALSTAGGQFGVPVVAAPVQAVEGLLELETERSPVSDKV
jgi:hypothetical protein